MKTLGVTAGIVILLVISMVVTLFTSQTAVTALLCIFGWSPAVLALGVALGRFVGATPTATKITIEKPYIEPAAASVAPVRQRRFPLSDGVK